MNTTWTKKGQLGKKRGKIMRRSMMKPVYSNPWDWVEYMDLEKLQDPKKSESENDEEYNVPVGIIIDLDEPMCDAKKSKLDETFVSKSVTRIPAVSKWGLDHLTMQRRSFVRPTSVLQSCMDELKKCSLEEESRIIKPNSSQLAVGFRCKSPFRPRFPESVPLSSPAASHESVVDRNAARDDVKSDCKLTPPGLHRSVDQVLHLPFSRDRWIFTTQARKYKYSFDEEM